jgi:hypothetical protein
MSAPVSQPPKVPLGHPLNWTDDDLDKLAEVSPQDVAEAEGWVRTNATPEDAALWEAKPEEVP